MACYDRRMRYLAIVVVLVGCEAAVPAADGGVVFAEDAAYAIQPGCFVACRSDGNIHCATEEGVQCPGSVMVCVDGPDVVEGLSPRCNAVGPSSFAAACSDFLAPVCVIP